MRRLTEKPLTTLHLTNSFHESSGGISTSYRAIMREAERKGRRVVLVVPGDKDRIDEVNRFASIHFVSSPRSPLFDSRYRLLLPHKYLLASGPIRKILALEKPDLVETTDKYTLNWLMGMIRKGGARTSNRPVLVGMSCERMDDNVCAFISAAGAARRFARFYINRFYLPMFDFHLANSDYTAEELRSIAPPRCRDRILVVERGVDYCHFSIQRRSAAARNHLLEKINGDPGTRILLYAGRLSPEKNIRLLIEVMERLVGDPAHDYRMAVAGDGPLADWFARESSLRAPGRIHLLGHVRDREELAYIYSNADALVHPNPREPFGIAPLEAMASGCPVVAPSAGGVLSYACADNAWIASPTADDFAASIREIFADPQRRRARVERALVTARKHDWPVVASNLFALYDELCSRFRDEQARGVRFSWGARGEREKLSRAGKTGIRSSHL